MLQTPKLNFRDVEFSGSSLFMYSFLCDEMKLEPHNYPIPVSCQIHVLPVSNTQYKDLALFDFNELFG